MERDRFEENHMIFIIGMISLILSLALGTFTIFLLPNLLFGWHYDVPDIITLWKTWLQYFYQISESAASHLIFGTLGLCTLIFAFIAYYSSNRIDNQIYSEELQLNRVSKPKESDSETMLLVLKILCIIVLVFIAGGLLEWSIHVTSPQPTAPAIREAIQPNADLYRIQ